MAINPIKSKLQQENYCSICKKPVPKLTKEQHEALLSRFAYYKAQCKYYGILKTQEPKLFLDYQGEHGVFYHTTKKNRIAKVILPDVDCNPDIFFCNQYYENTLQQIRTYELKCIQPTFPSIVDLISCPPDIRSEIRWSIIIIIKEIQTQHPKKFYRRLSTYLEQPPGAPPVLLSPSRLEYNPPPLLLPPGNQ